ncbi:DUF6020 family protein [Butyrivibrio sp.]|uniref:DUF6020 family protein n=1 Tax=Butyrivibrio sp. TaxID=28121 RepID=UPI0025C3783F|nr:DUF6020 family protein [Butyrivibrio sp.]
MITLKYNSRRLIKVAVLFVASWIPYFILFFPGVSNWDVASEIAQFFHIRQDFILNLSAVKDPDVFITNMHPFFDTIIFGSFIKIGLSIFGSAAAGQTLYSITQMIVTAFMFSGVIIFVEKLTSRRHRWLIWLVAVCPIFAVYSISMLKDTLFSLSFLGMVWLLSYVCLMNKDAWKSFRFDLLFCIVALLTMLTKNQGVYIVAITLPFVLVLFRKYWRQVSVSFFAPILFYVLIWSSIILPLFNVAPGGKQEAIGFMFQQTSLYVKDHPKDVSEDEKNIIGKILPYEDLPELYNPTCHDPVKYQYNQESTSQMRRDYYKVWCEMFFKHPGTYFKALIRSSYGYFYFDQDSDFIYTKVDNAVDQSSDVYISNSFITESIRNTIYRIISFIQRIPVINIIFSISFYTWLCIFALFLVLYKKKWKCVTFVIPALFSILIYIISPYNANMRYAMPLIYIREFPMACN